MQAAARECLAEVWALGGCKMPSHCRMPRSPPASPVSPAPPKSPKEEKLEKMMKDAEEQAERQNKAVGGIMNDPTQDETAVLPDEAMSDDEIEEQMLESNRIPSLMRR